MWLVTGGAGYIGSHVVRALQADGQRVVVVDDLTTGIAEKVPSNVQLEVFSVLDTASLAKVMHDLKVTGVVHLAAKKAAGESVHVPVDYHQENTGGVISLLAAMQSAGVRQLVYSSSAAVYGEPVDDNPLTEDSPTTPTNPYGSSKLIGEMMIRDAAPALKLSWAALRYFNVAGAGEDALSDTSANNLIPMLLRARVAGRPAKIFGDDYPTPDGTCIRDYIHVRDLADAHVLALATAQPGAHGIYNLGNGTGFSVREVIACCERVTGGPIAARDVERRAGDPAVLIASSEKAITELGWRPRHTSIDEIVADAWEFTRSRA